MKILIININLTLISCDYFITSLTAADGLLSLSELLSHLTIEEPDIIRRKHNSCPEPDAWKAFKVSYYIHPLASLTHLTFDPPVGF